MDWKEALAKMNLPSAEENTAENENNELKEASAKPVSSVVKMELSRKHRNGKEATVIYDFEIDDSELKALAAELKSRCGVGGSARDGEILLQGDCREKASSILSSKGWKVKRVGADHSKVFSLL